MIIYLYVNKPLYLLEFVFHASVLVFLNPNEPIVFTIWRPCQDSETVTVVWRHTGIGRTLVLSLPSLGPGGEFKCLVEYPSRWITGCGIVTVVKWKLGAANELSSV